MIVEQYPADVTQHVEPVPGTSIVLRTNLLPVPGTDPSVVELAIPAGTTPAIILEVPLGDAVAFWQPYGHWGRTTLPPDWRGATETSLVASMPMGCVYTHGGDAVMGFALSEVERPVGIRYGVSEEQSTFVVCMDLAQTGEDRTVAVKLSAGGAVDRTIADLGAWLGHGFPVLPAPDAAALPVYSTWYAHHHAIDAETLVADAEVAVDLGVGSIFLDFGWQMHGLGRKFEGCGDWTPDPAKFPDFAGFVADMHGRGLAVVAWVAPFLLGERSDAFALLSGCAPHRNETLDARILDPRHAVVRRSIVEQLVELVVAHDLDGLKIDFIETVAVYQHTPSQGDIETVSDAVLEVFTELARRLRLAGKQDLVIEHRQPYFSPALRAFANVLRAEDCPGDSVLNRTSIVDARLSTGQIVHSDMMLWHPAASPEQVARHLHSALFSVPQISFPLARLSPAHARTVRAWLGLWRRSREVVLSGAIRAPRPHVNYPVVQAASADGGHAVIAVYEPSTIVVLPEAETVTVVNATTQTALPIHLDPSRTWRAVATDALGNETSIDVPGASGIALVGVPESGWLDLRRVPTDESPL